MSSSFRCPRCNAYVSLERYINMQSDFVFCRCCGEAIHCPSVYVVDGLSFVPVPLPAFSPISTKSSLQPNGKIKKIKVREKSPVNQLDLFGGAA